MLKNPKKSEVSAVIQADREDSKKCFLGKFANGNIKESRSADLKCRLLSNTSGEDRKQDNRILVAESSSTNMIYEGKNFDSNSKKQQQQMMRHYVGIYDEETGKMRICDAELFLLQPHFDEDTNEHTPGEVERKKTYVERFGDLVEAFGSKRKKQSFEKKFRNKMDETTFQGVMTADARHGAQQLAAMAEQEAVSPAQQVEMLSPLPQCNKDATTVEDVYPLSVVITDEELDMLQSAAAPFFDSTIEKVKEWRSGDQYPMYILHHLLTLPMDADVRWQRCKQLIYLNYMIMLYKVSPGVLNKSNIFEGLPQSIRKKLYDNFTVLVRKSRCKPTRLKDRLAGFILLLCLHIDEYAIELDLISRDLHMAATKIEQILRAMGVRVSKPTKGSWMARLKLPLQFPVERKGGRGRR